MKLTARLSFIILCAVLAAIPVSAGDRGGSCGDVDALALRPVPGYLNVIGNEELGAGKLAVYPRIKKLVDGTYLMLCQGGKIASNIWAYRSEDLIHWTGCGNVFEAYPVTTEMGEDTRCFSTADAAVLPDGDVLAVVSFRASKGYKYNIGCGLMTRRSSDGGRTWGPSQVIYEGTNWEPYLLVLPDGRIHCYFTDCLPAERNSGTSVLVSEDGGHNWSASRKVCRQYKYTLDSGARIYTDQMPSFRVLKDGRTILGFLEARLEPGGPGDKSVYKMSLVRNVGLDWQPLAEDGTGPVDRETNLFNGCAGYVSVFPSGEVLLSCNIDMLFSMKLGDAEGRVFQGPGWQDGWYRPFRGRGYWGSTEIVSPHLAVGAMHCDEGIQTGLFYLNHPVSVSARSLSNLPVLDASDVFNYPDNVLFASNDPGTVSAFRFVRERRKFYAVADISAPEDVDTVNISVSLKTPDGIVEKNVDLVLDGGRGRIELSVPLRSSVKEILFNAAVTSGGISGFVSDSPEGIRVSLD
ncbi:MAG: hypothetical protein ACI3ZO_05240 [Candidatus Cryptobacteroides sp.]|nr:hypothetical protein [Bacteroidales bacterium]